MLGIGWLLAVLDLIPIDANLFEPRLTISGALITVIGFVAFYPKSDTDKAETPEQTFIKAVRNNWIDGVLKDALRRFGEGLGMG